MNFMHLRLRQPDPHSRIPQFLFQPSGTPARYGWGAMWHRVPEYSMFRYASLFAFACLTLAAAAFLSGPKPANEQQDNGPDETPTNRVPALQGAGAVPFHARFSLN
jgi:hypothetical protein